MLTDIEQQVVVFSTIDTALNTSVEIIKRIPNFPDLMDKADYALKLMAEGKLSLGISNNKSLI